MNRGWVVDVVQRLPAGMVSRAWGFVMRRRRPRVAVALAKRMFVAASGVDLAEAADPIEAFGSVEELFTRRLRDGARPVDSSRAAIVSPVDALVGACGNVELGTMLQVKGRSYSVARLLDDEEAAARFEGGPYATLYLAPRDYHRIHAPIAGEVREARVVPGRLLPVFPESVERVDELFARNERIITYVDSETAGRMAVVKVGATMVGRIGVVYDPEARTNVAGASARTLRYESPHRLEKGGELGVFELGSTVVLIGERGRVAFDHLSPATAVRVGERIGTVLAAVSAPARRARGTAKGAPAAKVSPGRRKASTRKK